MAEGRTGWWGASRSNQQHDSEGNMAHIGSRGSIVFAMVASDLTVIALTATSAQQLGYWNPDGPFWAKAAIVGAVMLLGLYLADLYKLDLQIRPVELVSRLF